MKKSSIGVILTVSLLTSGVSFAQQVEVAANSGAPAAVATTRADWHGYQKQVFTLAGHPAFVVVPKVAAPGNPWIWRTSFPDFHSEVDQELVYNGYHIGFIDLVSMLGSDSALDIMDQFYDQLRAQWKLAEKLALEPCSRGGLHAYRYAARHPERIACIFGDVPVMDLKSWPLGKAEQEVQDAMQSYGFKSEAELRAFKGNPLDLLEPIAKARIPIRHAICSNDQVVPPEENTLEAQRRLKELGHDMELVVVERSDQCNGHHFAMPQVFESAHFVMRHACVMPGGVEYFDLRSGMANCLNTFKNKKSGRVAFLGGSITYNSGWRDELMHFAMGEHLTQYADGRVPLPIIEHEKAARHYGCTTLNITQEVAARIKAGEFTWKSGFNSDVHPPAFGQRVYANSMIRMLDAAFAAAGSPKPHEIPTTLVDERSYVNGRFGKLEDAVLGKGFTLETNWCPERGGTRAGFSNVPALVATAPGAEFSYTFDGSAFGLFLAAGYDSCVLQFSIDGAPFQKVDTFTPWSKGLHLPWPIILADGLASGRHTITIQTTGDARERTALHVIHILES